VSVGREDDIFSYIHMAKGVNTA